MTDTEKKEENTPETTEGDAGDEVALETADDAASPDDTEETPGEETELETEADDVVIPAGETGGDVHVLSGARKAALYMERFIRDDHPLFKPGDTVKVHYKIIEGSKERIQVFEGVVISIKHSGLDKTFTVRKVSWNVGVERTFFYHSKKIDKIIVARRGRVRRAKIYYLRDRVGKAARIRELRKPTARNS